MKKWNKMKRVNNKAFTLLEMPIPKYHQKNAQQFATH